MGDKRNVEVALPLGTLSSANHIASTVHVVIRGAHRAVQFVVVGNFTVVACPGVVICPGLLPLPQVSLMYRPPKAAKPPHPAQSDAPHHFLYLLWALASVSAIAHGGPEVLSTLTPGTAARPKL